MQVTNPIIYKGDLVEWNGGFPSTIYETADVYSAEFMNSYTMASNVEGFWASGSKLLVLNIYYHPLWGWSFFKVLDLGLQRVGYRSSGEFMKYEPVDDDPESAIDVP